MIRVSFQRPARLDGCPCLARIDRCTLSGAWYESRVGQTVTIELIDRDRDGVWLWSREGGFYNCINKIKADDATLLPMEN